MVLTFKLLSKESDFIQNLQENDKNIDLNYIQQFKKTPILNIMINNKIGIQELNIDEIVQLLNELNFLGAENLLNPILIIIGGYITDKNIADKVPNSLVKKMTEFLEMKPEEKETWKKLIFYYLLMTSFPREKFCINTEDVGERFLDMEICYFLEELTVNVIGKISFRIESTPNISFLIKNTNNELKVIINRLYPYMEENEYEMNFQYEISHDFFTFYAIFDIENIFDILDQLLQIICHENLQPESVNFIPDIENLLKNTKNGEIKRREEVRKKYLRNRNELSDSESESDSDSGDRLDSGSESDSD